MSKQGSDSKLTLFQAVRNVCRLRNFSLQTEKHYLLWIKDYVKFHNQRHPRNMGEKEIEKFLSYLSISKNVAPSTQSQALNAIVFLYRHVLQIDLGQLKNIRWAKRKQHIPVVLTVDEVKLILTKFKKGTVQKLIAHLLYGWIETN